MGQIAADASFSKKFPRCENCGRALWITGSDRNDLCNTCAAAERQGREVKQFSDVKCDCGKLAIVDYPLSVITGSGSEITWLEPLCFPCWMLEVRGE